MDWVVGPFCPLNSWDPSTWLSARPRGSSRTQNELDSASLVHGLHRVSLRSPEDPLCQKCRRYKFGPKKAYTTRPFFCKIFPNTIQKATSPSCRSGAHVKRYAASMYKDKFPINLKHLKTDMGATEDKTLTKGKSAVGPFLTSRIA